MMTTTTMASPPPISAPLGHHHHHHPAPVSATTTSSSSPATSSPPPAATSSTSSSPTPPSAAPVTHHHVPAALLQQLPFRADLLLPNGSLQSPAKKLGGAAAAPPAAAPPVSSVSSSGGSSSSSKPVYATPSPVENTPQNNECKLVEVKGAKLASFTVRDTELLCLPQAFDLFLKHLVGGLHTVYTKLKRLDITPVVCNVEQVRVLRGLGAIQPGVNRCKLISRQDFETLYSDCTNASSRPGRPPKRLQSVTSSECATHHMLSHSGLMPAGILPAAGLSALAKKIKLEVMGGYHGNQQHGVPNGENGDHNPGLGLEQLPFMMMSHPLIPASLAPASVSMAMGQMSRLSTLASMANVAQLHHAHSNPTRAPTSVIKERVRDSPSPSPSLEEGHMSSNHSSSVSSSPSHTERTADSTHPNNDNMSSGHGVLGHSPNTVQGFTETDVAPLEYTKDNKRSHTERDNCSLAPTPASRDGCDRPSYQGQKLSAGVREGCDRVTYPRGQKHPAGILQHHHHAPFIFPEGLSSIETLLTNIQQGLLRVAIENARAQEKQDQLERTELKLELVRERELRESLERQLSVEQKNRVLIQKRLKKEKRNKRRLQEALEEEVKLRDQAESSLLHTDTPTDSMTQEADGSNHSDIMPDIKPTVQEGRVFLQTTAMY